MEHIELLEEPVSRLSDIELEHLRADCAVRSAAFQSYGRHAAGDVFWALSAVLDAEKGSRERVLADMGRDIGGTGGIIGGDPVKHALNEWRNEFGPDANPKITEYRGNDEI